MASDLTIERVLTLVELVPRGRVVSYGDLGKIVGIGPRQVGSFMAHHSEGLTWWRVTNASGEFAPDLLERARPHWLEEGIAISRTGRGCRIAEHRADLDELAARWRESVAELERQESEQDHSS